MYDVFNEAASTQDYMEMNGWLMSNTVNYSQDNGHGLL